MSCGGYNGGNGGNGQGETTVGSKVVQTTIVTAITDGQPQVHTTSIAVPICEIGDGQVQGQTTVCSGQSSASPISQISDGQVVHKPSLTKPPVVIPTATRTPKPPGSPVTQLPDGQPQGPGSKTSPSGTGSVPKPPPSVSPEVPVNGAAQLFSNIKVTVGILTVYYMLMGV